MGSKRASVRVPQRVLMNSFLASAPPGVIIPPLTKVRISSPVKTFLPSLSKTACCPVSSINMVENVPARRSSETFR